MTVSLLVLSLPITIIGANYAEEYAEAADQELFKACLRRDAWLSNDGNALGCLNGSMPWHGERSAALMRRQGGPSSAGPGGREIMHVHRRGSHCVAIVLSSAHAEAGDIVWQVDTRERTVSSFGVPGYSALVGSTPHEEKPS